MTSVGMLWQLMLLLKVSETSIDFLTALLTKLVLGFSELHFLFFLFCDMLSN
jgi:hypothetical protein